MKRLNVLTIILILLFESAEVFSQSTTLGTQTVNGSYNTYNLLDQGIFRQVRLQATSSAATGTRNWLFAMGTAPGAVDYTIKWCSYTSGLTLSSYNQTIQPVGGTASALFNYSPGGADGMMRAVTSGNYYTFNCTEYSTPGIPQNEYMGVLETSFNPLLITSVIQSPGIGAVYPENSVYVTVTTSATPVAGEYVYLRYSNTINFLTSTLIPLTITGTTGVVEIPCQAAGTTIYYYVYSSNKTSAAILTEVGIYGQMVHDMNTLSINNNGGPNYIYTVLPSIGFCGNYYVPSICYPTIASFVAALNAGSISCSVICNVAAGHTETAPAGGINLTQTGTAANSITFIKNGAGANPIIYAGVGTNAMLATSTYSDCVFSLNGSDYIIIDGIDIVDNNATYTAMAEYGYSLFKASSINGCQNNIIKNCKITLNSSNNWTGSPFNLESGATGILIYNRIRTSINAGLAITSIAGRSDNNKFYGNTILNVINGFVISGYNDLISPYTYYDQNNTIGIPGAGNVVEKYGNSATTSRSSGIYAIYQNNLDISYNTFNNSAAGGGAHSNTLYGVFVSSAFSGSFGQNISVTNNSVSLLMNNGSSRITGIKTGNANIGAGVINVSNNTIENCSFTTGATGDFYGIDQTFNGTSVTINDNIIQNNTLNTATTTISYLIYANSTSPLANINGNTLIDNYKTVSSSASLYGIYNASGSATGSITIQNNIIDGLSVPSASNAFCVGIRLTSAVAQTKTISNNTVQNISGGTSLTVYTAGILADYMPATSIVNANTISNISSAAFALGINCIAAGVLTSSSSTSFTLSDNTVSGISTTGATSTAAGIAAYATTALICSNNTVDNITVTGSTTPYVRGIIAGGGAVANALQINNNIISNIKHNNTAGSSSPVGIYLYPNSATTNIYNNHIYEVSGNASEMVVGIYATAGTTTYNIYNNYIQRLYATNSNNNFSVNGIYVAAGGSTYNVFYNTIAIGQNGVISGVSGFGVTGFYHGAGVLNLRNNIVYVNANPVGVGVASCVRKATPGAAATAPATTSIAAATNNNLYYLNMGLNNYIYVEGSTTTAIKNGYAFGGATTSVVNNLNNDPCFNILTASDITSYKYFMSLSGGGTRESGSFYDVPNFAGGAILPDNLKITTGALDYSESHAINIASPLITADYEGTIRQGNPGYIGTGIGPDIGADEGEFLVASPACYLLPIELISFTGWYNGYENELHWKTATEINSDHFEVQKSINGIDFIEIGSVDAAGMSTSELNYLFFDDNSYSGINYYRLKLVDIDGVFEYSNTIVIRVDTDGIPAFVIYPNPVNDILFCSVNSTQNKTVVIEITDLLGKTILTNIHDLFTGQNTIQINVAHLTPATYFIRINEFISGEYQVLKFLKQN